ncbi:MAG: hypothetical protein ACT4OJ_08530 [Bacteroidota bacterium]
MKGLENQAYLVGFIISNTVALLFLACAVKWPRIARLLFFLLFAWACWTNLAYSQNNPAAYQTYANLAFFDFYKDFITGWFSRNTVWVVGLIATCQGLIALSMLLKGWLFMLGCTGGIIFLLSIAPLGVGSGFPCTVIFAIALFILFRKGHIYLWERKSQVSVNYKNI